MPTWILKLSTKASGSLHEEIVLDGEAIPEVEFGKVFYCLDFLSPQQVPIVFFSFLVIVLADFII